MWRLAMVMALCPGWALAQEDDKARLIGDWYEVAQTPTLLEQDCHGTTAKVAAREDTRLTLKIACRKGSLTGTILPIEGVLVETATAAFGLRLIQLSELGTINLVVLWQAPDDSMAAIGGTRGEVGWVWSKTPVPDPAGLAAARQALVTSGFRASAIRPVPQ